MIEEPQFVPYVAPVLKFPARVTFRDLRGLKFGKLTVASEGHQLKPQRKKWRCVCDCGGQVIADDGSLVSGGIKSCGCLPRSTAGTKKPRKSLVGCRFGKLRVVRFSHVNHARRRVWGCICDCGNAHSVAGHYLANGEVRSCGCLVTKDSAGRWSKKSS